MARRAIFEPDTGTRRVATSLVTGTIPIIASVLQAKEIDVR